MIFAALATIMVAEITISDTPEAVASWVAWDLAQIAPEDRDSMLYVWIPPWGDARWHHASAFAGNTAISRAGTIQRPVVLASGWLQRWDLRDLVPEARLRPKLAAELSRVVDGDPYFRTQDGLLHPEIEAAIAPLCDTLGVESLPVVRADYFIESCLSSLDGGRYLELRGLADVQSNDNRTPEEIILAQFGVFRELAIGLDGDRRVGMFASEVTAKPRTVLALQGVVGDAWITDDIFDEDASPDRHAIYNLLATQRRGSEIILEMANGLHLFLITDEQGRIIREAPPQLVTDSRVPRPHTARLQGGAISCIRCHAPEGGLRACRNDVAALLSGNAQVLLDASVVDDRAAADAIATRYAGRKFDRSLRDGRERYAEAIDELTGGEMEVEELSDLVSEIYGARRYELIDATRALRELGYTSDPFGAEPLALLRELIAPLAVPASGVAVVEDPTLAALMQGVKVRRSDWDRVYGIALARSIARRPSK